MAFVYGETLPVLPESLLATYPYALIVHVVTGSAEAYNAYCMKDTTYFGHVANYEYSTGLYADAIGTFEGIDHAICNYTVGTSTEWGAPNEKTAYNFIYPIGNLTLNNVPTTTEIVWSNFDVMTAEKDSDGNYVKTGEVFFKAGSVDDQENNNPPVVLPDGTELPALPEGFFQTYPYALIGTQVSSGMTVLAGSENAFAFTPQAVISSIFSSVTYDAYSAFGEGVILAVDADGEWTTMGTYSTAIYFDAADATIKWSNHDILTLASIDTSTGAYEIEEPMYHKSDVNYRIFGGWMNTMGNCAREIGGQSTELTPFQIQDIFKSAGASVSSGWMEGLRADYLNQIEDLGLGSIPTVAAGATGMLVLMLNGVSSSAVDINPAPFSFNMYTGSAKFPNATNIGELAFMMNIMLKSVTAPNLRTVGFMAFSGCMQLKTLDFPLLETIGSQAFASCSNLSSFNFASIATMDGRAFDGCALTSVELPASFIGFGPIGGNAFTNCKALTTITVDENNAEVCAVNNVLYTKSMDTLLAFPAGVTTFTAPEEVVMIGKEAFYGNKDLTKVDLPETVSKIKESAFASCSALTALILRRSSAIVTAGSTVLGTIGSSGVSWYIYVPSALMATYKANENWSDYASRFRAIEDYPDICGAPE